MRITKILNSKQVKHTTFKEAQSALYRHCVRSGNVTTDTLLDLYLLFMRSEKEKNKNNEDTPCPVSFYLIDGFSKFECNDRDSKEIEKQLDTAEKVDEIIKMYKVVTKQYTKSFTRDHSVEYIKMIKMDIDYDLMSQKIEE